MAITVYGIANCDTVRRARAWLHLSYGLFYPRKRTLSRAAQLFVAQLRQVETEIQAREHRALARMGPKPKPQRRAARPRPAKRATRPQRTRNR